MTTNAQPAPPMESQRTHILIIRSATRILNPTLASLKQEFPDSKVTLLAPQGVEEAARQDPLVDEVLTIRSGRRMSVRHYGRDNLKELKRRKFDLAVALYNVDHGLGYSNIDALAVASGAKAVRGYNPRGAHVPLNQKSVVKKWLLERTRLLLVALNVCATVVLFGAITLGLAAEWIWRKLFASPDRRPQTHVTAAAEKQQPASPAPDAANVLTRV